MHLNMKTRLVYMQFVFLFSSVINILIIKHVRLLLLSIHIYIGFCISDNKNRSDLQHVRTHF